MSKYSFPEVEIALSSSNSSETPFAIAFPLFILTGASSKRAASIFKITSAQSKISFPNLFTELFLLVKASFLTGKIAFNEFLSKYLISTEINKDFDFFIYCDTLYNLIKHLFHENIENFFEPLLKNSSQVVFF